MLTIILIKSYFSLYICLVKEIRILYVFIVTKILCLSKTHLITNYFLKFEEEQRTVECLINHKNRNISVQKKPA